MGGPWNDLAGIRNGWARGLGEGGGGKAVQLGVFDGFDECDQLSGEVTAVRISVYHAPEEFPTVTPEAPGPDCAIAIDVLRATTTMCCALDAGADSVQAFSDLDELMATSEQWPADKRVRIGERGGKMMPGCDLGNSPLEVTGDRVGGCRLFMSTTNGTRALNKIKPVDLVLTAALTNRQAVVDFLKERQPATVAMVSSGWEGSYSLEDTVCAGAVIDGLLPVLPKDWMGNDEAVAAHALFLQWQESLDVLLEKASHGQRLLGLNNTADLEFCAKLDIVSTIPIQSEPGILVAHGS